MCELRRSNSLSKFIIEYLGHCESGGMFFIDFELAKSDLHSVAVDQRLRGTGCAEFPDAASFDRVLIGTLSGLVFLHESVNVAHNDIKPANLLLVEKSGAQIVKIGDLGLCTQLVSGKTFGTLGYSAPELYDAEHPYCDKAEVTYSALGKSDVFGLGVALIFVTEGEQPYEIPAGMVTAFRLFCRESRGAASDKLRAVLCAVGYPILLAVRAKVAVVSQHSRC